MKILDPTSSAFTIQKPRKPSEFEIQAHLYSSLKVLGLDVRGEVLHVLMTDGDKRVCRFDLVVFEGERAIFIIEVKTENLNGQSPVNVHNRQCTRYREYGIPVYYVRGMTQADALIERVQTKDRQPWRFDRFACLDSFKTLGA